MTSTTPTDGPTEPTEALILRQLGMRRSKDAETYSVSKIWGRWVDISWYWARWELLDMDGSWRFVTNSEFAACRPLHTLLAMAKEEKRLPQTTQIHQSHQAKCEATNNEMAACGNMKSRDAGICQICSRMISSDRFLMILCPSCRESVFCHRSRALRILKMTSCGRLCIWKNTLRKMPSQFPEWCPQYPRPDQASPCIWQSIVKGKVKKWHLPCIQYCLWGRSSRGHQYAIVCPLIHTNPIKIHRRDVNELQPPRKMVGYCRMFCGQVSLGATPGGANDREVWNLEGREGWVVDASQVRSCSCEYISTKFIVICIFFCGYRVTGLQHFAVFAFATTKRHFSALWTHLLQTCGKGNCQERSASPTFGGDATTEKPAEDCRERVQYFWADQRCDFF